MMDFCTQQELALSWAQMCYLSEADCWAISAEMFALLRQEGHVGPNLIFEQPGLLDGKEAACTRNTRTGFRTITFSTRGTTLLTLAHEMAHVVRPWDEPHHDEHDWMIAALLCEIWRHLV